MCAGNTYHCHKHIYIRITYHKQIILAWSSNGGVHHNNYYMWYGGNHVGQWMGSSVTNQYADSINVRMLPN